VPVLIPFFQEMARVDFLSGNGARGFAHRGQRIFE
jgi:hypothetical protein